MVITIAFYISWAISVIMKGFVLTLSQPKIKFDSSFTNFMIWHLTLYIIFSGLLEPTDLCDAGYVCVAKADNSRPVDGVTGYECREGYYCPKGSDQGIKCPLGTFSNQVGLENVTECEDCTPGKYCQTEGMFIVFLSISLLNMAQV